MMQWEKMGNEIIEQPKAKSNRRQRKSKAQPSSQSPLSHSSRRIRFDLADEDVTPTNDQEAASPCSSPKPKSLLSSAHKYQTIVVPKTSPRK